MTLVTMCRPRDAVARAAPMSAKPIDSDPPPVKTISRFFAPSTWATLTRASSRAARAARPSAWSDDGLYPPSASSGSIAAIASGRAGVVAAKSR
jgi:hypothetical protein